MIFTERVDMVTDILSYLKNCPILSEFKMNVDFLGKNPHSLSISGRPSKKVLKKYTDGDTLEMSIYKIRLRLPFGIDKEKNIENSVLTESLQCWVLEQSARGILPETEDDKIAISVALEFSRDNVSYFSDAAVYGAELALTFYKANEKGSKLC